MEGEGGADFFVAHVLLFNGSGTWWIWLSW